MKKVFCLVALVSLIGSISSVTVSASEITRSKPPLEVNLRNISPDQSTAEVRCGNSVSKLQLGGQSFVCDVDIIYCGNAFLISNYEPKGLEDEIKFDSDIPITVRLLFLKKCHMHASSIFMFEKNQIDELSTETLSSRNGGIFRVNGLLISQNLKISGSMLVGTGGSLCMPGNGSIEMLRRLGGSELAVDEGGELIAENVLRIDAASRGTRFTNSGSVEAERLEFASEIFNNSGEIKSESAEFQAGRNLENYGNMEFDRLKITVSDEVKSITKGINPIITCIQGGYLKANEADLSCNLDSFGATVVGLLLFSNNPRLVVSNGLTQIGNLKGEVYSIETSAGAEGHIGEAEIANDAEKNQVLFIKSMGNESSRGNLQIGGFTSNVDTVFWTESGGVLGVKESNAPRNLICSKGGKVSIEALKGKKSAISASEAAEMYVGGADNVHEIMVRGGSKVDVENSSVERLWSLDQSKIGVAGSRVSKTVNRANINAEDTDFGMIDNRSGGTTCLFGKTKAGLMRNAGTTNYEQGEHFIEHYYGADRSSTLKVGNSSPSLKHQKNAIGYSHESGINNNSNENRELVEDRGNNRNASIRRFQQGVSLVEQVPSARAILQSPGVTVSIGSTIGGKGTVKSETQLYDNSLPRNLFLKGENIGARMDHIPDVSEIPQHKSKRFVILADVDKDFVNRRRHLDYEDVALIANMNGHKWENNEGFFAAGSLAILNASEFANYNGVVCAREDIFVQAMRRIFNSATPGITRNVPENGDHDPFSRFFGNTNSTSRLSTHSLGGAGIFIQNGSLFFQCQGDIENRFSNILVAGSMEMSAGGAIRNAVGNMTVMGVEGSVLEAREILNACMPPQQQMIEVGGRGGRWRFVARFSRERAVSTGSDMWFTGPVNFVGHVNNIGSTIMSGSTIRGDISSVSSPGNTARQGSAGALIEGDNINLTEAAIWIYEVPGNSAITVDE